MDTCVNCELEVEDAFNFCPNCGSALRKETAYPQYLVLYKLGGNWTTSTVPRDNLQQAALFAVNTHLKPKYGQPLSEAYIGKIEQSPRFVDADTLQYALTMFWEVVLTSEGTNRAYLLVPIQGPNTVFISLLEEQG